MAYFDINVCVPGFGSFCKNQAAFYVNLKINLGKVTIGPNNEKKLLYLDLMDHHMDSHPQPAWFRLLVNYGRYCTFGIVMDMTIYYSKS